MLVIATAALLLQGENPSAKTTATNPTPAIAASKKPDGDKVVCRSEIATGSMFGGPKECHTKSEWAAINAASRDDVNSFQQRSNQSYSPR